jgi:hypothetical protein
MKHMLKLFFGIGIQFALIVNLFSQDIQGAWQWNGENDKGESMTAIAIVMKRYQVVTFYNSESGEFLRTSGGSYSVEGNTVREVVEFDSADSSRVGKKESFQFELGENSIKMLESDQVWTRMDDGSPGELAGAWIFSGRKESDGTITERDTNVPRKTMKMLSGTRFQWIAYNTETQKFIATGGGNYTTENGKYTENIEFFSRDVSKVGASLEFDYEIINDKWHHTGNNSRDQPMYEMWSPRE